jgi:hypothetical protein
LTDNNRGTFFVRGQVWKGFFEQVVFMLKQKNKKALKGKGETKREKSSGKTERT